MTASTIRSGVGSVGPGGEFPGARAPDAEPTGTPHPTPRANRADPAAALAPDLIIAPAAPAQVAALSDPVVAVTADAGPYWEVRLTPTAATSLADAVDLDALARAVSALVARHEVLRTRFATRDGELVQVIDGEPVAGHWHSAPGLIGEGEMADGGIALRLPGFDPRRGTLFHVTHVPGESSHRLLMRAHPAVADDESLAVLVHELLAEYAALRGVGASPRPPRRAYLDAAAHQLKRGPLNDPSPVTGARATARSAVPLERARLAARAAALDVPVPALLCAAAGTAYARHRGLREVRVGLAGWSGGRAIRSGDGSRIVGPLADLRVLRLPTWPDPGPGAALEPALAAARRQFADDLDADEPTPEYAAAVDVAVRFLPASVRAEAAGVQVHASAVAGGVTRFPAELQVQLGSADSSGAPDHDRGPVAAQGVPLPDGSEPRLTLLAPPGFESVLGEIAALAQGAAGVGDHVAPADALQEAAVDFGRDLVEYLGVDVARDPVQARIATRLAAAGVGPDDAVGLCVRRDPLMLDAILACWWLGAQYVPLDPAYPPERLRWMAEDTGARVFLVDASTRALAAELDPTARLVQVAGPLPDGAPAADADALASARVGNAAPPPANVPGSVAAYTIFTSGSTGRPKGVVIPRSGVVAQLAAFAALLPLGPADTVVAVTTLSFDISVLELLLPLVTGARLVVADEEQSGDAIALRELLTRSGATFLQATPGLWRTLAVTGGIPPALRLRLCGGEALPRDLAAILAADGAQAWNVYGPTETTIWASAGVVPARRPDDPAPVLVGPPIPGWRWYVLDPNLEPVPEGVVGDIWIAGPGVARGYAGRPGLTARVYRPDPTVPGERMYLTGDLGARRPGDRIELHGRADHQVKIRGFRIETEEIEVILRSAATVRDAAVIAAPGPSGRVEDLHLVGYVEPALDGQEAAIRARLSEALPAHMQPALLIGMDSLPRTPNGKLDRRALPVPAWPAPGATTPHGRPPAAAPGGAPSDLAGAPPTGAPLSGELGHRSSGDSVGLPVEPTHVSTPNPEAPAPETPAPATPDPPAPAAATPAPSTPDPATPDSATPDPGAPNLASRDASTSDRDPLRRSLAELWTDVLGVDEVGPDDNFFALGGHSLSATFLVAQLNDRYGLDLRLRQILLHPTVAQLADYLADQPGVGAGPAAGGRP